MSRSELLFRYGTAPIPRYTSYPSANLWGAHDDAFARQVFSQVGQRPLSLYLHVPFCHKLCLYCGCNMLVTRSQARVERYLSAIEIEIERTAALLPKRPEVVQIHLGGGTPTFLNEAQLTRVMRALDNAFVRAPGCETSIEVHPAVTTRAQIETLGGLGFNRLSLGVQDFDEAVQARIGRRQPFEQTRDIIEAARACGFCSVNVDLMYGLPLQTTEGFGRTLDLIESLRPERLALFGYAHMPSLRKHQAVLTRDLPGPELRLALLELGIERLERAGYAHVGLDHFALANDELCVARSEGTLRRNFMGYTTCAETDVLAFGPSAIAEVDGDFVQNARELEPWATLIEEGKTGATRGWRSSDDDDLRRDLIQRLFCDLSIDVDAIAQAHGTASTGLLEENAPMLRALVRDGLVHVTGSRVRITKTGQLFLRNVAAVFDAYLDNTQPRLHSVAI